MTSVFDLHLAKRLRRRIKLMAKNMRRKGRSARNGNAPSPYCKYQKRPHQYSAGLIAWRNDVINNRRGATQTNTNKQRGNDKRSMLEAAE